MPFLFGTSVWWLLWKFCLKFTLNTYPRVEHMSMCWTHIHVLNTCPCVEHMSMSWTHVHVLNTCPWVVFIKFRNPKRFFLFSERHFKQIIGKSVEIAFYAKTWNLDREQNHCSKKIEDFIFPTKPIISCYFCQLLIYEIF